VEVSAVLNNNGHRSGADFFGNFSAMFLSRILVFSPCSIRLGHLIFISFFSIFQLLNDFESQQLCQKVGLFYRYGIFLIEE
jgi:hypothetical protein